MGALGDVLELLHRGGERIDSVQAVVRTWEHRERALAAWDAAHRRRATDAPAVVPMLSGRQTIREAVGRIWWDRAGGRLREEIEDSGATPRVLVRVGERWWSYDDAWGARTNDGEPDAPHGAAFTHLLAPAWYLGALRLSPTGEGVVGGRRALLAHGEPRAGDDEGAWTLHDLGSGADAYELAIDAEHGILLRVEAFRGGVPFARAEVTEVVVNVPIDAERFAFAAPPGEQILPLDHDGAEHLRSLQELAERLPFPVFALPEGDGWTQLPQLVLPGSPTGPLMGLVAATRGDGGGIELTLQRATRILPGPHDGDWRDEIRGGRRLRVRAAVAGADPRACVRLDLDGTRMELRSADLDESQLAEVAAMLVRVSAPAGSPA